MTVQAYNDKGVREERTGWRDQELSNRHRLWGFNCPCVDIDTLMIEYNLGEPVAIVEYKHCAVNSIDREHPSYCAINKLATRSNIPFLIAIYYPQFWGFKVIPMNELAKKIFKENENLSEQEYVRKIYLIRSVIVEHGVLKELNDIQPENWE